MTTLTVDKLRSMFDVTPDGRVFGKPEVPPEVFPEARREKLVKLWATDSRSCGGQKEHLCTLRGKNGQCVGRILGAYVPRAAVVFAITYGFFPEMVRVKDRDAANTNPENLYPSTRRGARLSHLS